jgi:hypothetical protein
VQNSHPFQVDLPAGPGIWEDHTSPTCLGPDRPEARQSPKLFQVNRSAATSKFAGIPKDEADTISTHQLSKYYATVI